MIQQIPSDLIPIAEAVVLTGHSDWWIRRRLPLYQQGRTTMVSRQAAMDAAKEYDTPKPKEKPDDEKGD